ncbi:response regulator transcription factor [Streptomyces sp. NBC_01497]|uniref:response regulator transcription factor n=1 Tax=Streptomyces sp. NBC_01497 TaxID=2903885 RepID=UPI002E2F6058|nr:response regulator transcription factor [Streptomyces sp. NBC_01497]
MEQLQPPTPTPSCSAPCMPHASGLDLCCRIQHHDDVRITMVTAKDEGTDVGKELEASADDYVFKPTRAWALDARKRAILRTQDRKVSDAACPRAEPHAELSIERARRRVTHPGGRATVTSSELRLLQTLLASPRLVFSHLQPLEAVGKHSRHGDVRLTGASANRFRSKLSGLGEGLQCIQTLRGTGYRFCSL